MTSLIADVHTKFLTSVNGEPIWVRADDPDESVADALTAYAKEYGLETVEGLRFTGVVHMRSVPHSDDPDWHEQVKEPGKDTALYRRFDA